MEKIIEVNVETGEVSERQMTPEEQAALQESARAASAQQATATTAQSVTME